MPGLSGLETVARIREHSATIPEPKFILVTAYGREEVLNQAEDMGLNGILLKPITPSTLFDSLLDLFTDEGDTAAGIEPRGDSVEANRKRLAGQHVLIVEDNEINQEIAVELLSSVGMHTHVVGNGKLAVEFLASGKTVDCILMDLQMPVMDGFEATRSIRSQHGNGIPIIAMTANAMAGDRERSLDAGMNDHITKPVDVDALYATLDRWVHSSGDATAAPLPASGPSDDDAAAEACLEALEGFDVEGSLKRVGGKARTYVRLLRQFAGGQSDVPARTRTALQADDLNEAETLAHGLKGVAGNLGAQAVHEAATALNAKIRDGDKNAALGEVDRLDDAMTAALATLQSCLPDDVTPAASRSALGGDELLAKLESLNALLTSYDGGTKAAWDAIRGSLPSSETDASSRLDAQITSFEFDEATETLAAMLGRLKAES
jgi:CheY-like chemotaxis protein